MARLPYVDVYWGFAKVSALMFLLSFLLAKNDPVAGGEVLKGSLMAKEHESNWNVEDLPDADVYAEIRYLETDRTGANEQNSTALAISVPLAILLIAYIAARGASSGFPASRAT
jgi:hypothetical protein